MKLYFTSIFFVLLSLVEKTSYETTQQIRFFKKLESVDFMGIKVRLIYWSGLIVIGSVNRKRLQFSIWPGSVNQISYLIRTRRFPFLISFLPLLPHFFSPPIANPSPQRPFFLSHLSLLFPQQNLNPILPLPSLILSPQRNLKDFHEIWSWRLKWRS